jgi:eukaryotic-like serine/threonine-protein kinase
MAQADPAGAGPHIIGRRLSHYRVLAPLGEGGMGVVYRARDEHLDRDVAIKVLPPGTIADEAARRRLRREALALSRLQHPHLLAVYDFDSAEGVDFLVMELVPGTTLAGRLRGGPLHEAEVLRIGTQIAEALAEAHERGIVHRDLKPGNVMLTPQGEVKVLDFGLARQVGPAAAAVLSGTLTDAQALVGTMPYMAPEQLLGREVDARSDVYALGVVLYELATGHRPFEEVQSFALGGQILNQAPVPPGERRAGLSRAFDAVVTRCLAKDPGERFATAAELAVALGGCAAAAALPRGVVPAPEPTRPPSMPNVANRGWHRWPVLVTAATVLIGLAATSLAVRWFARPESGRTIRSLAVLPLANLSGDAQQEYFADGMTDELITTLSQLSALKVISRTSVMQFKGTRRSLPQVARALHVDAVLEGSVLRAGARVRIAAQLIEAASDRHLWAGQYERQSDDVIALQNDVARAVAEHIRLAVKPAERARLASARSLDPAAHEAYLKGLFYSSQFSVEGFRRAVAFFTQAIEADPTYAPAYAGLARAYAGRSSWDLAPVEAMPRVRAAATRAIQLDPGLAAGHAWLGYVAAFYDWDWTSGERGFRRAIALNPNDPDGHLSYGTMLVVNRRFAEAEQELRRARELDPLSLWITSVSLWPLYEGRRYDDAIAAAQRILADNPRAANAHQILGQAWLMKGDSARALPALRRAQELDINPSLLAFLGSAYALSGNRAAARQMLDSLRARASAGWVQPYAWALVYAGLGQRDSAFRWLERGVATRSEEMVFLQVDPAMDVLRSDPRFRPLLRKVGFGL